MSPEERLAAVQPLPRLPAPVISQGFAKAPSARSGGAAGKAQLG